MGDLVFLANWKKVGAEDPEGPASDDRNGQDDIAGGSDAEGTDADASGDGGTLAETRDAIAKGLMAAVAVALCAAAVLAVLRATGFARRGAHAMSRRAKTSSID